MQIVGSLMEAAPLLLPIFEVESDVKDGAMRKQLRSIGFDNARPPGSFVKTRTGTLLNTRRFKDNACQRITNDNSRH